MKSTHDTPDRSDAATGSRPSRRRLADPCGLSLSLLLGAGCTLHSLDYLGAGVAGTGGTLMADAVGEAGMSENSATTTMTTFGGRSQALSATTATSALVSQGGTRSAVGGQTVSGGRDTPNLALGKPATAATAEAANPASNGNDSSLTTRWCATGGAMPEWWTVDLQQTYPVTGTQVTWEFDGRTYGYLVEVSVDATSWKLVIDKRSTTSTSQIQRDTFSASARYVRLTVTSATTNPMTWASFYDFAVFGS